MLVSWYQGKRQINVFLARPIATSSKKMKGIGTRLVIWCQYLSTPTASMSTHVCVLSYRTNPKANVSLSGKKKRLLLKEARRAVAEKAKMEGTSILTCKTWVVKTMLPSPEERTLLWLMCKYFGPSYVTLHCERRGQSINLQYTLVDSVKLCEQWLQWPTLLAEVNVRSCTKWVWDI